jgi:hypothetical membrane protein
MFEGRRSFGALAWLATLQFFVAEAFAAAAFPTYNYRFNYISDLGAAHCAHVCSPRHAVMNASFVLQGVLILAGVASATAGRGLLSRFSTLSLAVSAIGVAVVGLAPEDVAPGCHYAGAAANLLGSNLGALGCGSSPGAGAAARSGVVAGALGLAGCAALGLHAYEGLGVGAAERIAAYPFVLWLAVNGAAALVSPRRGGPLSRAGGRAGSA